MAIDLNTLFTSLGIVSGNTQSTNQYEFYKGIVWSDASVTNNQKEFFDKVGLSRYDFFKQYGSEKQFYEDVDDTRVSDMRTFYQYAGQYLAGADPEQPPVAGFSADATQSVANTVITFTNTTTGTSPLTYAWDFGDGGTSTDTNPTYSYSATGSYTITLTASNAFGTDSEIKTDYISIGDLVVASFSSSTYSTTPDTVITFTDTSTGNPTSWAWDFGDGNIDVTQNPTHSYSATGSYVVTMTASSVYDTDSTSDVITVEESVPAFVATGGITASYTEGDTTYMSHTFLSDGTFEVVEGETTIEFMLVGGGGSGFNSAPTNTASNGGGGGGGVLVTSDTITTGSYNVVIGNGGLRSPGEDTTFKGLTAYGGAGYTTLDGGCGAGKCQFPAPAGGPGDGVAGQGFGGGNTHADYAGCAAGGGGAGAVGVSTTTNNIGGAGGAGKANTYRDGTTQYYGGGGGGAGNTTGGAGGIGGGGNGYSGTGTGFGGSGTPNTGGGAGGRRSATTGDTATGGSGIVVIRYAIS